MDYLPPQELCGRVEFFSCDLEMEVIGERSAGLPRGDTSQESKPGSFIISMICLLVRGGPSMVPFFPEK